MDIQQNYFQLFDLDVCFRLDQAELKRKHRHLQTQFHPDKFSQSSAQEQRLAVQYAAYINQAWQVLSDPVMRGEYMLELKGWVNDAALTLKNDNTFLMQQMEWREAAQTLANSHDEKQLEHLQNVVLAAVKEKQSAIQLAFEQEEYEQAKALLHRLQFMLKFESELSELEDSWDD